MSDITNFTSPVSGICCVCKERGDKAWYCQNCEGNICSDCKTKHLDKLISWHHQVVPSDEQIYSDGQSSNEHCALHVGNKYTLCCEDCDVPVCNDCVIGNHQRHKFTKLTNAISIRKKEVARYRQLLESDLLPKFELDVRSVTNDLEKYKAEIDSVCQRIEAQRDELKIVVDTICDRMLNDVTKVQSENARSMEDVKDSLLLTQSQVQNLVTTCNVKLNADSIDVIEFSGEQPSISTLYPMGSYDPFLPTFIPGQVYSSIIHNMFGSLGFAHAPVFQNTSAGLSVRAVDVEVQGTIKVKIPVNSLKTLTNSLCLVCTLNEPFLYMYGINGMCKDAMIFDSPVDSFVCSKSYDYMISLPTEDRIAKVTKTGLVKTIIRSNYPRDICVNQQQHIVICLMNERKLEVYTKDGKTRLAEICQDGNGRALYERPFRVVQNKNGDYCVIDLLKASGKRDRIVTVNKDGHFRWTYNGTQTGVRKGFLFLEGAFVPRGICCDRYGNVLVSDFKNHVVDLLDREGKFLMFLLTSEQGINKPLAMDTDGNGRLWVGQYDGTISIVKYLH